MKKILSVKVEFKSLKSNLEKILLYTRDSSSFFHIVSINPEILVIAKHDQKFSNILSQGDIQLPDGIGVLLGCALLGIQVQNRVTGVDFMDEVLKSCNNSSLRVLFLGGKADLAEKVAIRYQKLYPSSKFKGIQGISDIMNPTKAEEEQVLSIVADYKPQILLVAFGSPYQEKWLFNHRDNLKGIICMGVGGGFDFAAGTIKRAPKLVRSIGLEWLYRLIQEPWRWKRQLRLIEYLYLLMKQRFEM